MRASLMGRLRGSVTLEHGGPGGRIHAESWKAAGAPAAERGTDTEHKCAVCGTAVDAMYFDDDATGGRVKVSCWQQRRRQSSTAAASSSKTAADSASDVAASTTASGSLASFLDVQASFDAEAALPPLRLTRGALGWVYKQGRKAKTWKRRWAVIRAACLVYYTDASCATLKGSVPLAGARVAAVLVTDAPRALGPREGFEVVHAPSGRTLVAFPQLAEQHASGDPAAVRDACRLWVAALEASIAEATGATGAEEAAAAAEQRVLARQSSIEIGGEAAEEDEASEDDGDGLSLDGVSLAVDDGAPPPPPPPVPPRPPPLAPAAVAAAAERAAVAASAAVWAASLAAAIADARLAAAASHEAALAALVASARDARDAGRRRLAAARALEGRERAETGEEYSI